MLIGSSLRRREDGPLLRGEGRYVEDVRLPGMLHMAVVRSPYPHARLGRVDLEAVRQMPGVIVAAAAADLADIRPTMGDPAPAGLTAAPRPVLAVDRVRYVGEPVAVVVAEDRGVAMDAAEQVEVEYTPLDGVGNVGAASRAGAPVLHDALGSNVAGVVERSFGDIEAAFADNATVLQLTVRLGRV